MSRPNKPRSIRGEANVRANVIRLRAEQTPPMTREGLAQRMTDNGCPLPASAIWKIENGKRSINADELLALSRVFGIPIDEFFRPSEEAELARLLEELAAADEAAERALQAQARARIAVHRQAALHPSLDSAIRAWVDSWLIGRYGAEDATDDDWRAREEERAWLLTLMLGDPADSNRWMREHYRLRYGAVEELDFESNDGQRVRVFTHPGAPDYEGLVAEHAAGTKVTRHPRTGPEPEGGSDRG